MIWIGLAIVVVTFYLIYKNYEARLVLALSGLVMGFIGQVVVGTNGGVSAAVDAFVKQLVNGGLVPTIVTVMGFGYVMTFTKCSDHLVNLLVKPLARVPVIVIPGAVIITWLLNIVLPSAAGIAAAVGVLLIPALIALKVRPVMAAAAVFIGTWGSVVSPGLMFNPQIADIARNSGTRCNDRDHAGSSALRHRRTGRCHLPDDYLHCLERRRRFNGNRQRIA